jgi:O-glycosyl hydrolase
LSAVMALLMGARSYGQSTGAADTVDVVIDGSEHFQKMDGFGVNINTSWWLNGRYQNTSALNPAIDLLADSLGATIFRAVIEEMDWEATNDNNDPGTFNWDYYDQVFTTERFQGVWNTLRYLNQKGITDGLVISFMGAPPASKPLEETNPLRSWMGDTTHAIYPEKEDEFVETIAAWLYYARHRAHIRFTLVSPMNETDIIGLTRSEEHPGGIVEGPNMPDAVQVTRVFTKLARKLDVLGMEDVRFVAPDAGGDRLFSACLDEMVQDPYLMGKLACWGVHDYGDDAANYLQIVNRPANPNPSLWVTETAGIANLFGQLDDQASAFIFWDGFDGVYQHARRNGYGSAPPNDWVFWIGEEGKPLIQFNTRKQKWVPRKQFYEYAQLFRYIRPGAVRIAATANQENPSVFAFLNPDRQLVLVGRNSSDGPVILKGELKNLARGNAFEMFYTDTLHNLTESGEVTISGEPGLAGYSFEATVPAHAIFTLVGQPPRLKPEPLGWYAGDMHVHRDCGGPEEGILPEEKFIEMMEVNDLAVISVLADMGDAEVKPSEIDLQKVNGEDYHLSVPGRTVHYDAEWHWDPAGATFEHMALGGHLVLLGLKEAHQIWDESPYRILEYGRSQDAVAGFCHMEYLTGTLPETLDCCTPIDYPVEAALGTIDFLAEDVWLNDEAVKAYYRLLNCGFRLGWAAGTDYPCNNGQPLGSLLTYVRVEDAPFSYRQWVEGIKNGRTVVATNGHVEFLDLVVNGGASPGDELKLDGEGTVSVEVTWTAVKELTGTVELVCNGKIVATLEGSAGPGAPLLMQAAVPVGESSWICARRMDPSGHQSHTAPVYISINNRPVRASAADADYFVQWIAGILQNIEPGGPWNQYFTHDLDVVQSRYREARDIYAKVAQEAREVEAREASETSDAREVEAREASETREVETREAPNP